MDEDTQQKILMAWLIVGLPLLVALIIYWFYLNEVNQWIVAGVIFAPIRASTSFGATL